MRTTSLWTRKVVVPRLRPDVVVVGFSSGELNDHWNQPDTLNGKMSRSHYGRIAAGTGTVIEKIDDWMVDHVYLMRYRSVLRKPVDAVHEKNPAQLLQAVDRLGRLQIMSRFQQRPYSPGLSRQLGIWDKVFRNYRAGGAQFAALDGLVSELTGRGIRVVLVRMPVTADVIPLHPDGIADRERFGRVLASFAAAHPVTFIDAEAAIGGPTGLFVDPLHLNTAGERRVTTFVLEKLRP
jgi:hypothetical protein